MKATGSFVTEENFGVLSARVSQGQTWVSHPWQSPYRWKHHVPAHPAPQNSPWILKGSRQPSPSHHRQTFEASTLFSLAFAFLQPFKGCVNVALGGLRRLQVLMKICAPGAFLYFWKGLHHTTPHPFGGRNKQSGFGKRRGQGWEVGTQHGLQASRRQSSAGERGEEAGCRRGSVREAVRAGEHCFVILVHARGVLPTGAHCGACGTESQVSDVPALILPGKPEFDLLFPNFLVVSHLEYLLKIEEGPCISNALRNLCAATCHITSGKLGDVSAWCHSSYPQRSCSARGAGGSRGEHGPRHARPSHCHRHSRWILTMTGVSSRPETGQARLLPPSVANSPQRSAWASARLTVQCYLISLAKDRFLPGD